MIAWTGGYELGEKEYTSILQNLKIEGVEYLQIQQVEINHNVNEYARANLRLIVDEKKGKKFLQQANADKIKITLNKNVLFQGYIASIDFERIHDYQTLRITLYDAAYLLDWKFESQTFQNLKGKYEEIFKTIKDAKIQLKVKDKNIEKMIIRLNETSWQFIKRLASHFSAMIFTDITAEKPLLTIGLPESKKTAEISSARTSIYFDDRTFQFLSKNTDKLAKGTKIVAEDFQTVRVSGNFDVLSIGDTVKFDKKEYRVKSLNFSFVDNNLYTRYSLVGKSAFVVPIEEQKNIAGRIFRAQVKKVEKDKIQAHFVDIDKSFDSKSTNLFPFATSYSSADGSGWYAMPEVDDYVRILTPSEDLSKSFAVSSINSAPLKEPKNKSLKAPGGREILLTDKGVEIIAEHQKTFILIDKDKGINVVSAKDIAISADGNINLNAKGKVQIVAQSQIAVQSGQSHMKLLANQIDMGGGNIIVGE